MKHRRTLKPEQHLAIDTLDAPVTSGTPVSEAPPVLADADGVDQHGLVALEAYFIAERRGFAPGCELDDWLAAETIVAARLHKLAK